ncbi:MAG: rod shape-determining protein RodA [Methylobacillus sp.]|jgi:rod shape determining protein RodA|nr:rod shape-determining protein RodA [Methylobacillus sp.]
MISAWLRQLGKRIDKFLLGILLLTLLLALVVLFSASGQNPERMSSQAVNILIALGALWLFANIPPQHLQRIAVPLYLLGMILLVGVFLFGDTSKGAQRWLNLGVMRIQPSELMKIAVPMMLAWYFDRRDQSLRFLDYIFAAILLVLPVGLILKQPDLGTAMLVLLTGITVIFFAGLSWKVVLPPVILGVIVVVWFILNQGSLCADGVQWQIMRDYQQQRICTLANPARDPLGAGYHTIQATIALGSGGLAGKGWLHGTQSQLDFLPERHTDFILAVFGEEFGLIGNLLLLTLFAIIIGRGLVIAASGSTTFSRLLAGSIASAFFIYAFVNMGMVSGILPVVGVPLPLISYGGTSLVTLMIGFGILMSIQTHKKLVQT